MTAFDSALATLHADTNLATVASYRHPPYTWQSVRVILSQPTDAIGTAIAGSMQAEIMASAITDTPQRGDELRIGATTYTVESAERDVLGLSWKLTLSVPAEEQWITLEAETSAWLAQVTTRPNDELLAALNDFIAGLKSDGLWTQILKLWWLGAPTEQASTIEFKSPGISTLVKHGAMAFSALQGWRGGNSSGASVPYLETGYAIPAGNQNSMAAFVRSLEAVTSFAGEFGGEKYYINPRSTTATDFRTRSASITSDSLATIAATAGSFGISRTGSASYKKFIDGAAVETVTRTSTVPDATTMWLCSWQNTTNPTLHQSGGRRVAMAMIAAGLSDADVLKYYNRETTFLQAIGTL